jgi:hypothetical protein
MMSESNDTPSDIGTMIVAKFQCDVWDEDLDVETDWVAKGDLLLVIGVSHPRRPKRLNKLFYRHVLTPRGKIGWIHLDNCSPVNQDEAA